MSPCAEGVNTEVYYGFQIKTGTTWRTVNFPETVNNLYSLTYERGSEKITLQIEDMLLEYRRGSYLTIRLNSNLKGEVK
jgi:hypothetical protein